MKDKRTYTHSELKEALHTCGMDYLYKTPKQIYDEKVRNLEELKKNLKVDSLVQYRVENKK